MVQDRDRQNLPPLSLHVPEPHFRPGDEVDFSDLIVPPAGETRRPDEASAPAEITDLAYGLVRVLDDEHRAIGPWDPRLDGATLLKMLRAMALNDFRVRYLPRVIADFQMGGISTSGLGVTIRGNLECLRSRREHLNAPIIDAAFFLRFLRRIFQLR